MGFMWVYGTYTQAQRYSDTMQRVWVAGMGIRYVISGGHIFAEAWGKHDHGCKFLRAYTYCRNGPGVSDTHQPLPSGFEPSPTRYHMSARKFYIFRENFNRILLIKYYIKNQLDIYSKIIYNQLRCWIATNRMQGERLAGRKTFVVVYGLEAMILNQKLLV